jgi:polyisoprenoid-binding protein YceI
MSSKIASTSRVAVARACVALIVVAVLAPAPAAADPVGYRVDPARSAAEFIVTHLAVLHAHGRFARMSGRIVVHAAAQTASADLEISATSVSTAAIHRRAFGLDFAWPFIGDDVDLVLRIRAVRE